MSVIVKGMKMPKNCMSCPFPSVGIDWYYCYCPGVDGKAYDFAQAETVPDDCPLVALPDTHGDLIDRQKLIEDNKHLEYPTDGKYRRDRAWAVGFNAGARHCNEHAVYAKTVIEAEGEE